MEDKVFGWPVDDEKEEIRKPSAQMIRDREIVGWEDSVVFESVKVGLRKGHDSNDWIPKTDFVLI